jgi:cyanate permease
LIAILLVIPWILTHNPPKEADIPRDGSENPSALERIRHIAKIKNIWLLSLAIMCFNGAVQGFLGYLPLYLRNTGWQAVRADGLAATFHLASMIFAIPISFLSDKVRSRRKVLLFTISLTVMGIGSFFFFRGDILWAAVIAAGISRDGIMAVLITSTLETKGVGRAYSGIATGFILIFASIGGLISPSLGNHLATLRLNLPFVFWSVLCFGAVLCVFALKEYQKTTPDE